jgi:threonine/homoserine/homoserine lactone efflux protein
LGYVSLGGSAVRWMKGRCFARIERVCGGALLALAIALLLARRAPSTD